jgi:hypothetical protein
MLSEMKRYCLLHISREDLLHDVRPRPSHVVAKRKRKRKRKRREEKDECTRKNKKCTKSCRKKVYKENKERAPDLKPKAPVNI